MGDLRSKSPINRTFVSRGDFGSPLGFSACGKAFKKFGSGCFENQSTLLFFALAVFAFVLAPALITAGKDSPTLIAVNGLMGFVM